MGDAVRERRVPSVLGGAMTDTRAECVRLKERFLEQHADVADRLENGDTGQRYAAYLDVLGYVMRNMDVFGDWRDRELQRAEAMDVCRELCGVKR